MLWRLKLRSLFNKGLQQDIDDELRAHIDFRIEELQAEGMSLADARREALKSFGNYTRMVETTREVHLFSLLDSMIQDLRYAFRRLCHEPAFTLAAVVTLALVIGANGAVFSVFEAVFLRALPFEDPDRLVLLSQTDGKSSTTSFSMPAFDQIRSSGVLAGATGAQTQSVNLTGVAEPGRLIGNFVSSSYFQTLGVTLAQGRTFTSTEDTGAAARVCILGFNAWRDRFGSDPGILGRTLTLNAQPYTVIGVISRKFESNLTNAEVWIPLPFYPNYTLDPARGVVDVLARLAPDITRERAQAELTVVTRRALAGTPTLSRIAATPLRDVLTGDRRQIVWVLTAAVGCVLLIGCVNIAGLLLTKATGRRQEIAVRISLGAGRARVVRQLLTEAVLLAMLGGAAGLLVARAGMMAMTAYCADLLQQRELVLNSTVVGYLAGASLLAGLIFGLVPAFSAQRGGASSMRQRGSSRSQGGLSNALVAGQVGLSLVLLVGAGLLAKSLMNVAAINPGFRGDNVLTAEYRVPITKYNTGARQTQIHYEIAGRLAALSGVESAALIGALPFSGNYNSRSVSLPGSAPLPGEQQVTSGFNPVTPGLFRTIRIPLLAGRDFTLGDTADSAPVAVVSQGFAERFWQSQNPIGRQIAVADRTGKPAIRTVVGLVGNIRHNHLGDLENLQVYVPSSQEPFIFATLAVRTRGEPTAMVRAVQQAVWAADKDQPMWKIRTLQSLVDRSFSLRRYVAYLVAGFSGLALLLAAIGLYGLLAYTVSQRTGEFGVRLAIGATPSDLRRLVLRRGMLLILTGLLSGVAASLYCARFLETQVYEISATDPKVYLSLCAVMFFVAIPAMLLPARRAMRIDPVTALRQE